MSEPWIHEVGDGRGQRRVTLDGVEMKFRYKDYFKAEPSTGYETLIYDCMIGDNILFQRADSVEAGWQAQLDSVVIAKNAAGTLTCEVKPDYKSMKVYIPSTNNTGFDGAFGGVGFAT